jgi:hypothetical protein
MVFIFIFSSHSVLYFFTWRMLWFISFTFFSVENRKAGFHDQPSPKFMTSIFHDRRPEARWQLKNET